MKFTPIAIAGALLLAGCAHEMTVEEARALCTKQGGLLMVIYTQKVTLAGIGPEVAKPGNCVSTKNFDKPAPAQDSAAAPAPVSSSASAAPASGTAPGAAAPPAPASAK